MILTIGSKVRLWVSNDKPQEGFINQCNEHDNYKVYYGNLIGKNKDGSFEIVVRDCGESGGSIHWPDFRNTGYNASFIEKIEVLEYGTDEM